MSTKIMVFDNDDNSNSNCVYSVYISVKASELKVPIVFRW